MERVQQSIFAHRYSTHTVGVCVFASLFICLYTPNQWNNTTATQFRSDADDWQPSRFSSNIISIVEPFIVRASRFLFVIPAAQYVVCTAAVACILKIDTISARTSERERENNKTIRLKSEKNVSQHIWGFFRRTQYDGNYRKNLSRVGHPFLLLLSFKFLISQFIVCGCAHRNTDHTLRRRLPLEQDIWINIPLICVR